MFTEKVMVLNLQNHAFAQFCPCYAMGPQLKKHDPYIVLLRPAYNKLIFSKWGSLVVSSWESDPFGISNMGTSQSEPTQLVGKKAEKGYSFNLRASQLGKLESNCHRNHEMQKNVGLPMPCHGEMLNCVQDRSK